MTEQTNNMCLNIKELFADYLTGELIISARESVRNHVTECNSCHSELEELSSMWSRLGVLEDEQPSPNLRKNFYSMLEAYQEKENQPNLWQKIKKQWSLWLSGTRRPAIQLAFTLVFLLLGFVLGLFFTSSTANNKTINNPTTENLEITNLRNEVNDMRQKLVLAMLNQTSPSNRLKAISVSSQAAKPGPEMLEALLHTLNNDSNVNVRVSAAEALYLFIDNPMVKKGVIDSLPRQSSPMVQVAILDLLAGMREKTSLDALKRLINNDTLNPAVKKRAKQVMKQMI
jgi:hypothetical protein